MYRFTFLILIFSLAGCAGNRELKELSRMKLEGDQFPQQLAQEYRQIADSEERLNHRETSRLFAAKGLLAAQGKPTALEPVDGTLPQTMRPQLEEARASLEKVLTEDAKKDQTALAAKSQILYDCWLIKLRAGHPQDQAELCRNEFYQVLNNLKVATGAIKADVPDAKTVQPLKGKSSGPYVIRFGRGSIALTAKAKKQVKDIAHLVKKLGGYYEVAINGHADRKGKEKINMLVSRKRAGVVKEALVKRGLDRKRIALFAFGESDPAVSTKDGVSHPANRRVEVLVNE